MLIIGASGGVGSFAVQIAKASGAEVTGVCSTGKMTLLRAIGADHIIDYTRDDVVDGVHRYDVILDIAGNRPVSDLRRALTPDGTLVIVGAKPMAAGWVARIARSAPSCCRRSSARGSARSSLRRTPPTWSRSES